MWLTPSRGTIGEGDNAARSGDLGYQKREKEKERDRGMEL